MARAGNQIYATDYTDLKKQLDAELNRRGKSEGTAQGHSVGSMSAYIQTYTTAPGSGRQIINEHIQKITQPLSAITGSSITPASGSEVAADVLTQAVLDFAQQGATRLAQAVPALAPVPAPALAPDPAQTTAWVPAREVA